MLPERPKHLDDLFSSNRPPSPQECTSARGLVQLCDEELTFVESQLTNLQKQVEQLLSRKSVIQGNRRRYLDVLSARRQLPPEIIASFIQLAVALPYDDNQSQQPRQARYRVGSVLPFMLVSKEWCETACSIAHFWTELKLDVTEASGESTLHLLETASKWSQRASELPLSLTIALSTSNPLNDKVVQFAHSIAARIGAFDISFEANSDPDLDLLAQFFRGPFFPRALMWLKLHTLHINMRSQGNHCIDLHLRNAFSDPQRFPALRSVAIVGPQGIFSALDMPWSGLSTLRLDSFHMFRVGIGHYLSILGQCANLQSLHLSIQGLAMESCPASGLPLITLPRLTHLYFEYTQYNERFIVTLLAWLQLPSLQTLTSVTDGHHTSIVRNLIHLFQRSECQESLKYLEINLGAGLGHSANDLRSMFRETPRLSGLKISGQRLHAGCLSSIPESVQDLTVGISFPAVDDARDSFINFLRIRNRSLLSTMKARLDIVDSTDTVSVRASLEALKAEFGSTLDVVMS